MHQKPAYILPPPVITLILVIIMGGIRYSSPAHYHDFPGRTLLSILFSGLGILICLCAAIALRRARTTLSPTVPHTTSTLVTWGIYRISRNPIYTGLLCILTGWSLWLGHPVNLIFLPIFIIYINRFQIIPEEQALQARFGIAFIRYTGKTRRWI